MFSNKIDTYAPVKDDKLKSQSNQSFDFEGEGFSSMLEQDEVVSGKLRETDAELLEDESILSTDEENRAIAKKRSGEAAQKAAQKDVQVQKPETDTRNLLKLMDMSNKVNPIHITKSKKELENITGTSTDTPEELAGIVTKLLSDAGVSNREDDSLQTTVDVSTSEDKMSDSGNKHKDDTLHETQEELLEDMSILSTDEENLAMVNKAKEYKALSDDDFSHNGEKDMELLTEIISINNQSGIEVNSEHKAKNAESVLSQAIEESKKKLIRLNLSELTSEDVDYIINLLQNGTADSDFDNEENPSALSAKFLAALKDSIINKKVFRIDFDNEISVIIKIDTEGKISANFLTSSKELGEGLKNNLYILRQRFEEQGIKYGSIDYTASENEAELDMQEIVNIIQTADTKEKTTH